MHLRYLRLATTIVAITLTAAACGGESTSPARTSTARPATATAPTPASTSRPATAPAPTGTSRPATPTSPAPATTPTPAIPTAPPGATRRVRAPIDAAEMIVRESFPVQYAVRIVSGLPSGCHTFDGAEVTRNGTEITIAVWNRVPSDARIACTAIYGTHEEIVELGSDFRSGVVYHVAVNDLALTFTAQ